MTPLRVPAGPGGAGGSWYLTAAIAGAVAAVMLAVGGASRAIAVGGVLAAVAAVIALIEGYRRHRQARPSMLAVALLGGCAIAAAVAALLGVATGGLSR